MERARPRAAQAAAAPKAPSSLEAQPAASALVRAGAPAFRTANTSLSAALLSSRSAMIALSAAGSSGSSSGRPGGCSQGIGRAGRLARRVFPSSTASPFLLFLAGAGSSAAVPPRAYLPTL